MVDQTRRRVPVIAGTGSNSTAEAIRLTAYRARSRRRRRAPHLALLQQADPGRHLQATTRPIASARRSAAASFTTSRAAPARISLPETFARLCEIKQIVGIKEASGSMDQCSDILRLCGDRLTMLSGDDSLTLPLMAMGAQGRHLGR